MHGHIVESKISLKPNWKWYLSARWSFRWLRLRRRKTHLMCWNKNALVKSWAWIKCRLQPTVQWQRRVCGAKAKWRLKLLSQKSNVSEKLGKISYDTYLLEVLVSQNRNGSMARGVPWLTRKCAHDNITCFTKIKNKMREDVAPSWKPWMPHFARG